MSKLLLISFLFSLITFSQEFRAGIITGINTSQVSGDNLAGFNKLGIRTGVFLNTEIDNLIAQIELQYINKGSRELIDENDFDEGYKFQLNYAEMPMSIKIKTYSNVFIELGLSIGHLLSSSEQINGYEENGLEVNKIEYSTHVGIDYLINEKITLNTRIANSISPIRQHNSGQTYLWNKGQYNTSLSFIIYYYL